MGAGEVCWGGEGQTGRRTRTRRGSGDGGKLCHWILCPSRTWPTWVPLVLHPLNSNCCWLCSIRDKGAGASLSQRDSGSCPDYIGWWPAVLTILAPLFPQALGQFRIGLPSMWLQVTINVDSVFGFFSCLSTTCEPGIFHFKWATSIVT